MHGNFPENDAWAFLREEHFLRVIPRGAIALFLEEGSFWECRTSLPS
jgi:hypothetical protein